MLEEPFKIIPPEEIIHAYRTGYFPMAESSKPGAPVYWYTAHWRGIIPMVEFHISRRTLRYIRKFGYEPAINTSFEAVVSACAQRESTWISPEIKNTFLYLHQHGYAHSVEVMQDGELAGGLYGLALGGAFFAESVFQNRPEAHKAAMLFCHQQLKQQGFLLWDVQFFTEHLAQFGCRQIKAAEYKRKLNKALAVQTDFM